MHALTTRGRVLLAVGLVAAGTGWALDQPAVVAVAVLLALLPALGALLVRRSRFVLGSARTVEPTRLPFGTEGEVLLTVENGSRFTSGALLLEDNVPAALGAPTRLVLDRVSPRAQRSVRYRIEGRQRGRARLGPLAVVVTDPFGTARVTRTFSATNAVLVTPQIVALGGAVGSPSTGGTGDATFRAIAARGDDDLLPREHRPGDDMRRIHWRATARQGELMVRREEQSWHSSVTVVLDDRASAHHGTGPASTFEWAVSAAASIALHYVRLGWRLTAITTTGRVLADVRTAMSTDLELILQAFAEVREVSGPMVTTLDAGPDGSTAVVAVLGRVDEDAARSMARPIAGFAGCLLLEPRPEEHLRAHGWRVAPWSRHTSIADAWGRIAPEASFARLAPATARSAP